MNSTAQRHRLKSNLDLMLLQYFCEKLPWYMKIVLYYNQQLKFCLCEASPTGKLDLVQRQTV